MEKEKILKKHVGLIHCEGKLTLLQRKISNILIFNALSNIREQDIFYIGIKNLCSMIGYKSNDIDLIKKALKKLISLVLEWNVLQKNGFQINFTDENSSETKPDLTWHASALLAGVSIENGVVTYSYSPQIKNIIASLDVYGQINLFVQSKFKSSYSLALYENCVRFKRIKTTPWFNLKVFRDLLGIDETKYSSYKELSRSVINPAIKEINEKADIFIKIELKKLGRAVVSLKFTIEENSAYLPKIRKKTKMLDTHKLELKKLLTQTFKISELNALKLINEYGISYIREKLDRMVSSHAYKNKQIQNIFLYLSAMLEQGNNPVNTDNSTLSNNLEESKEDTKAFSNQYLKYKVKTLLKNLDKSNAQVKIEIIKKYEEQLRHENSVLFQTYKKKHFESAFTASDFLEFVAVNFPDNLPKFLSYDEFITQEEVA